MGIKKLEITETTEIFLQSECTLNHQHRTEWTVPYRTKLCRTKVTLFFGRDEKFYPTKICPTKFCPIR